MKITQALKSYYAMETPVEYEDTDFDIVDAYVITGYNRLVAFQHSHTTAHVEIYDGTAWEDLKDSADNIINCAVADDWVLVPNAPMSSGGTAQGSLRIAGSGVDNSTLRVHMFKVTKTEG